MTSLPCSGSKFGMPEDSTSIVPIRCTPAVAHTTIETRTSQESEMSCATSVAGRDRRSLALQVVVHKAVGIPVKSSRFYARVTLGRCGKTAKTECSREGSEPAWDFSTCFDYDGEDSVLFELRAKKFLCSTRTVGFAKKSIGSIACGWEGDLRLYLTADCRKPRNGTLRVSFLWPNGSMSEPLRRFLSRKQHDEFAVLLREVSDDLERIPARTRSPSRGQAHLADLDSWNGCSGDDADDHSENEHAAGDRTACTLRLASTLPIFSSASSNLSTLQSKSNPCGATSLKNLSTPSISTPLKNRVTLPRSSSLHNLTSRARESSASPINLSARASSSSVNNPSKQANSASVNNVSTQASSSSVNNFSTQASSTSVNNLSAQANSISQQNRSRLSISVSQEKSENVRHLSITRSASSLSSPRHLDDSALGTTSITMAMSPNDSGTRESDSAFAPPKLTPSCLNKDHKDGTGEATRLSKARSALTVSLCDYAVQHSSTPSLSATALHSRHQVASEPHALSPSSNVSRPTQPSRCFGDERWEMDHRSALVGDGSRESSTNSDIAAGTSHDDSVYSGAEEVEHSENPFGECSESTLIAMKKLAVTNNNHILAARIRECQLQRIKKNIQKTQN